jgi:hypothetical protein
MYVRAIQQQQTKLFSYSPTVAGDWSARLLHILKVTGSHLGPETGHRDKGLCGCPQSSEANSGILFEIWPQRLPFVCFQFIIH